MNGCGGIRRKRGFLNAGVRPRHIALAVLIDSCFGMDLQAAHLGAPDGFRFARSPNFLILIRHLVMLRTNKTKFESMGLAPILRQAISLIPKFDELIVIER